MPTINDSITKSDKKSKRKHQDPEPESEPSIEPTKKDKKKKKKNKQTDENEPEVELTEKKKKKKKQKTEEEQEPKTDEVVVGATVDVDEVRKTEDNVVVPGKDINNSKYKALTTFSESNLSDELLACCKNFAKPSPIQLNSWPFLLNGRDFIGIAKTGSGKTLAFGIPAMNHILNKRKSMTSKKVTPLCLAFAPTRELAQQVYVSF